MTCRCGGPLRGYATIAPRVVSLLGGFATGRPRDAHGSLDSAAFLIIPIRIFSNIDQHRTETQAWFINWSISNVLKQWNRRDICRVLYNVRLRSEEHMPGVYSFPLFREDFCDRLLEEIFHFYESGLPARRPNSMNNYGASVEWGLDHWESTVIII